MTDGTDAPAVAHEPPERLADVLRLRRLELRLNQRDLAAQLGVKQQTVSRWESGTALPRPERVAQLSKALGLPRLSLLRLAGYIDAGDDMQAAAEEVADLRILADQLKGEVAKLLAEWEDHSRTCPGAGAA